MTKNNLIRPGVKKLFWITLVMLMVFILVFFLIQKNSKKLDSSRIALIDVVEGNYLFRGNNPFVVENGREVFAYNKITSYFNDVLRQKGYALLRDDYYLLDVSLLDVDQYNYIKKEEQFFTKYPDRGMLMKFSTLSPSLFLKDSVDSNFLTKKIKEHYSFFITNNLKQIYSKLENSDRQIPQRIPLPIHHKVGQQLPQF